ncbi:MAG: M48 family metallopeptidase [Synechocystis sp.]|nr:M48 family metallopeptidase [Synechocystis sp.]
MTTLCLGSLSKPLQAKPKPNTSPPPSVELSTYEKAKQELPEDFYVVYRILERIARANSLDKLPWRVVVIDEYNINAFATDQNLVAIFNGLLDQVEGDPSAIACVIAHEMAHHTQRHIAMGMEEKEAMIAKFTEEAQKEVLAEAENAQNEATGAAVGGAILQGIGGIFGGWGGAAGSVAGGALAGSAQQRLVDAQSRIEQIVQEKQAALEAQAAENDRRQEFEADKYGYEYMAKAGFEAEGCLRLMDLMARIPGSHVESTHPATRKRIEQLQTLMRDNPPGPLAEAGKLNLNTSKPLTYSLSRDGQSLRVNSRGGSTTDAIDKMF